MTTTTIQSLLTDLNKVKDLTQFAAFKNESFVVDLKEDTQRATKAYVDHDDVTDMVDKGISFNAVRVYQYLYNICDGKSVPTATDIGEVLKLSERVAQKARKELINAGYVYDRKIKLARHSSHICFLGLNQVRKARLKAALVGLMEAKKMNDEDFKAWTKTEEFKTEFSQSKELSIYPFNQFASLDKVKQVALVKYFNAKDFNEVITTKGEMEIIKAVVELEKQAA